MLRINEFKVENLSSGCVTDNPAPVFSFSMISSEKNVLLKKAVLSVNNWMEEFRQQTGIVYNGPKLTPFTRYLATLEITDNYGETASTSLEFETGFVGKEWNASWITDGAYQFKERKKSPRPMTFKKDFFIKVPESFFDFLQFPSRSVGFRSGALPTPVYCHLPQSCPDAK